MERISVVCNKCSGFGYTSQVFTPDENGKFVRIKKDTCEACDGKGCIEKYAQFTIEEAEAILKYCGLKAEAN